MGLDVKEVDVWVLCRHCGEKHQLKRGMDTPVYWCGNDLQQLVEGDEVEYDDKNAGESVGGK